MTTPPYEWPTRITGPVYAATARLVTFTSSGRGKGSSLGRMRLHRGRRLTCGKRRGTRQVSLPLYDRAPLCAATQLAPLPLNIVIYELQSIHSSQQIDERCRRRPRLRSMSNRSRIEVKET